MTDISKSIYLTFDIDWCSDFVLLDTINLLSEYKLPATFFVTHHTAILDNIRKNKIHEIGIHPNFNKLFFSGDQTNGRTPGEIIENLLDIVSGAKVTRSHSLTQSSKILDLLVEKGLTHDCNVLIPFQSNEKVRPWRHFNGLVRVPYGWEDDVACLYNMEWSSQNLFDGSSIKTNVFDFHPIHVYLNTDKLSRYETAVPMQRDERAIKPLINQNFPGVKTFLCSLIEQTLKLGYVFSTISEISPE